MTGNLTTSADISGRDVIATRELNVDGNAILNSTLTVYGISNVNGTTNLNSVVNIKNAVTISGGRGTNNSGA